MRGCHSPFAACPAFEFNEFDRLFEHPVSKTWNFGAALFVFMWAFTPLDLVVIVWKVNMCRYAYWVRVFMPACLQLF